MKNKKSLVILIWGFALLPVIITFAVYGKLPENIPMHWNIHGEIDSWSPKFPWAFAIPFVGILIAFMMWGLPKFDPKKENYEKFKPQYLIIKLLMVVFFAIIQIVILSISMGASSLRVDTISKLLLGILFIVFGNLMPKLKHNYFVGIKTPWTIASEAVWARTHRHGGIIWFITGFLLTILSFIPGSVSDRIYFFLIIIVAVEPTIYSYLQYARNKTVDKQ